MFIKRIIIDGFKSYKEKVILDGFDDSFNAITGFNGSGKSNILDAICFVLGLSRLDVARCQNLRDLVYKSGKAGILSAKVTIELDNSQKIFDKPEWRNFNTISVSRTVTENNQSKFQLNDRTVTKEAVLELFQSVKLNISNPHFLIMQGKVVKVSTMKPTEILSMIYEAIGVTIYETKRKHNISKIQKCEDIVKDYKFSMDKSIIPKLKQLKAEEKGLKEFRMIENELLKMTKISVAFTYLDNKLIVENFDDVLESIQKKIEDIQNINTELKDQEKCYNDEIEEIHSHLKDDVTEKLNQAKEEANEVNARVDNVTTEKKLKTANLTTEERKYQSKQKEYKEFQKKSDTLNKKFTTDLEKFEILKNEYDEKKKQFDMAEKQLAALSKGQMANVDDNSEQMAASLTEQLQAAKITKLKAEKSIEHNIVLITRKETDIVNIQKEIDSNESASKTIQKAIQSHEKEIDKLKQTIIKINFNEEKFNEFAMNIRKCQNELIKAQDYETRAFQQVPSAKFDYTKPSENFDERNVFGVICTLFNVEDKRGYTAIEKIIGGRFFNVVVRNTKTATDILQASKLRERRTFLPIDNLKIFQPDRRLLSKIQDEYGEDNVKYLIDLVSYDRHVENAMTYVFRDVIICEGIELANEIAFKYQRKTVTYHGEMVDPRGYMTTSSGNKRDLLPIIEQIKESQKMIFSLQQDIYELQRERSSMESISHKHFDIKKQINVVEHELEDLKRKFNESPYQLSIQRLNRVKTDLEDIRETLSKDEKLQETQKVLIEKLNDRLANFELYKARDEKELAEKKKKAEEELKKCSKKFEDDQTKLDELRAQLDSQKTILTGLEEELENFQKIINDINEEINELNCKHENELEMQREMVLKLKELQRQQDEKSSEIAKKRKKIENLKKTISENNMNIKKIEIEIDEAKQKEKSAKKTLIRLVEKYDWILEEEKNFNSLDSDYKIMNEDNFNFNNFQESLKQLIEKKRSLEKHVNLKAIDMTGEQLQELDDLQSKSNSVQQDRETLTDFMNTVEIGKEKQVAEAWRKVSKYFNDIFSTLLPAANCKLEEVTPGNLKDGLRIRVALANMWKDSLMELSGGQRSLVALSLILALLKYNPAPLYILDEVDAALDNSHTQNIGIMIKKYFTDSQFVVVSLKEGMFSNANVIFETSFVDGRSYVQRKN